MEWSLYTELVVVVRLKEHTQGAWGKIRGRVGGRGREGEGRGGEGHAC